MRQIPNILENTGISKDYVLAFGSIDNYLKRIKKGEGPRWIKLAVNVYLNRPILKYGEYFNSEEYEQVITNKNHERVKALDEIAENINKMRENGQKDYETLFCLWKKAKKIIFGEPQEFLESKI